MAQQPEKNSDEKYPRTLILSSDPELSTPNLRPGGKTQKKIYKGRLRPEVQLHTIFMQFLTERLNSGTFH